MNSSPAATAPLTSVGRTVRYAIPKALRELDTRRHQVIEASAGTGKTYLIEHRVVDLLLATDTPIEQILVVTFTEKATAELRVRVRRLLETVEQARDHTAAPGEPHWVIDSAARRKIADALLGFDRAAIHTIHAFCQRVLTENAFASRRLFAQTQVAGEAAFAEAFKAVLREEFARKDDHKSYVSAWYRSGKSVDDLERLLFRCANQSGRLMPGFDEVVVASRLRAACAEMPTIADEDDPELSQALKDAGVRGSSVRAVLRRLIVLRRCLDRFALDGDVPGFLATFEAEDRAMRAKESLLAYVASRLQSADIDQQSLRTLRDVVLDLEPVVVPLAAAVAQRFLPAVRARTEADKSRHGQFDFQDMLNLVWQSFQGNNGGEVIERLRSRYRYALIDEFQDTDELQWQIFRRLYLDSEDNRLCIIGDPKQAIYSFRGADVFTYLTACREVQEQGGQNTNLTANYRSTDDLVRAYNAIFANGFFTGDIRYDHPVCAATDLIARDAHGGPIAPICVFHIRPDQGKLRADPMRQALLNHIAAEIHKLLFEADARITVGSPPAQVPVHAGDIFVLTRTTSESNDVAERLRQAGVPSAIYKQEGLFQTREALEVRDLLCGIAEPRNRSARFRAWCTRFFGARLADLPHLGNLPETHPYVARLYAWKAMADRLDYETLFARIIDDSSVIERELFFDTSERSLTNFKHIFELLLEEVMRSRCELHELVQRLQRWMTGTTDTQADERNVQRLESERNAVQIMTIHRSKGLEAKVVFLYGGFGAAPGDEVQVYHEGGERLVHVGYAHRDVAEAVGRESESENQRLLYVAVTRAVARVYLPYVDAEDYAMRGAYRQLNRRLEAIVPRVRSGDADLGPLFAVRDIATGPQNRPRGPSRGRLIRTWEPPETLFDPAPPAIDYARTRECRSGFVVASYTSMKASRPAAVDLSGAEEDEAAPALLADAAEMQAWGLGPGRPLLAVDFKADEVSVGARAGEDELPGGAQSGVFLHSVLEHVPFASAAGNIDFATWRALPTITGLFADAMLRYNRDPNHLAYSQRVVFDCLTTPLRVGRKTVPQLALCRQVMREVEFLYPIPTAPEAHAQAPEQAHDRLDSIRLERGYIKGFIDLICEWQGRVYLVDWKSDILPDYGARAVARHVFREYQLQVQLYTLALAKMLELKTDNQHKRRFGGLLYCFMRGMGGAIDEEGRQPGVYYVRPSLDKLAALEAALRKRSDYR